MTGEEQAFRLGQAWEACRSRRGSRLDGGTPPDSTVEKLPHLVSIRNHEDGRRSSGAQYLAGY